MPQYRHRLRLPCRCEHADAPCKPTLHGSRRKVQALRLHGNLWFCGETETVRKGEGGTWPQVLFTSAAERMVALAFLLASLPLALKREDAAVVHAAWQPASFEPRAPTTPPQRWASV